MMIMMVYSTETGVITDNTQHNFCPIGAPVVDHFFNETWLVTTGRLSVPSASCWDNVDNVILREICGLFQFGGKHTNVVSEVYSTHQDVKLSVRIAERWFLRVVLSSDVCDPPKRRTYSGRTNICHVIAVDDSCLLGFCCWGWATGWSD